MKGALMIMSGAMVVVLVLLTACAQTMNFGFGDTTETRDTEEQGDDDVLPTTPQAAQNPTTIPDKQPKTDIRAARSEPNVQCGDTLCEGTENTCNCPTDCGSCEAKGTGICEQYQCTPLQVCVKIQDATCCGNAACENGESCDSCFVDCCTTTKTLKDFPEMFKRVTIVVGKEASAQDVVTAANLAAALKQINVDVGETKLDSETYELSIRDYVVVGSPCDNTATATLLGIDAKHKNLCQVIPKGEGEIRLIPTSDQTVALLITGGSPRDVERAAKRLTAYQQRPLSGTIVKA